MNQRVVFFVALVCVAQLGITIVRNFWSEQSRRVQHVSLARSPNVKSFPSSASELKPGNNSDLPAVASSPKRAKASKGTPARQPLPPAPQASEKVSEAKAASSRESNSSTAPNEVARNEPNSPVVNALLPSPSSLQPASAQVAQIAQQGTRDPFVPFFSIRKDIHDDSKKSLTEYDLDELKITAIVSDSRGGHFASVKTPSGRDFIVRSGSMIGSRGGKVITILPSKLVVVEPTETLTGSASIIERELSLKIPSPAQSMAGTN